MKNLKIELNIKSIKIEKVNCKICNREMNYSSLTKHQKIKTQLIIFYIFINNKRCDKIIHL